MAGHATFGLIGTFLLLSFLGGSVVESSASEVQELTDLNFDRYVDGTSPWMIDVYAPCEPPEVAYQHEGLLFDVSPGWAGHMIILTSPSHPSKQGVDHARPWPQSGRIWLEN